MKDTRVFIQTYGCRMNACDTEIICAILRNAGFSLVHDSENADVAILNCCSVREDGHIVALDKALKYKSYWSDNGGITISGGEPLLQIDFVTELFRLAKKEGVNTCIDTSGANFTREEPFFSKFNELMKYTDLLLVDIKHMNDEEHCELTGKSNKNILDMARYLSQINKPVWIRHVLVPGISDKDEYLIELDKFINTLNNVKKVEVLPYHTLGTFKWEELGIPYKLEGVSAPSKERIDNANKLLHVNNYQ